MQTPHLVEFWQVPQFVILHVGAQVVLSEESWESDAQMEQVEEVAQVKQFLIWQTSLTQVTPFNLYPSLHWVQLLLFNKQLMQLLSLQLATHAVLLTARIYPVPHCSQTVPLLHEIQLGWMSIVQFGWQVLLFWS